ncbi:MAG: GxxExxY protein [Candidatus Binatia bacterium]
MYHEFEDTSRIVIGLAIDVHRQLGPGFVESIYHRALLVSLDQAGMPYLSQVPVEVVYLGVPVGVHRIDVVVNNQVILELKSVRRLLDVHFAQIRSYLRASGLKVGLVFNFNAPALVVKRIVQ